MLTLERQFKARPCRDCSQDFTPTCGTQRWCPSCRADHYRAVHGSFQRRYWAAHPDKKREANAQAYRKNAEARKAYQREWRKTHVAKRSAASLERSREYDRSPERRAHVRHWWKSNPIRARELWQARQAREKAAFVEDISMAKIHERDRGRCWLCRRPVSLIAASLDHVIPLSKGGKHEYTNARIAHLTCNSRKSARVLTLF
jgi:5-methylcytosine-specific restriction endonuclease McrA